MTSRRSFQRSLAFCLLLPFAAHLVFNTTGRHALATEPLLMQNSPTVDSNGGASMTASSPIWVSETQRLIDLYFQSADGEARTYLAALTQRLNVIHLPNRTQSEAIAQQLLEARTFLAPVPDAPAGLRLLSLQLLEQAVIIYRTLDQQEQLGMASVVVGRAYAREHVSGQSMRHFNRAMGIYEALGDADAIAAIQADIQMLVVDADPSFQYLQELLQQYRVEGNLDQQGRMLFKIANLHVDLQQFQAAIDYFEMASRTYQEAGNIQRAGLSLARAGYVYYDSLQQFDQALAAYQRALAFYEEAGFAHGIRDVKEHSEQILFRGPENPKLVELNQELENARQHGDKAEEASVLHDIGTYYQHMFGEDNVAVEYLLQARDIYREIGESRSEAHLSLRISYTYGRLNQLDLALASAQSALLTYQDLGDAEKVQDMASSVQQLQATLNGGINLIKIADEVIDQYIGSPEYNIGYLFIADYQVQANILNLVLEMDRQINDLDKLAYRSGKTAEAYILMEDYSQALAYFQDAYEIYQQRNDYDDASRVLRFVGEMYFEEQQDWTAAIDYLQQSLMLLRIDCSCYGTAKPILELLAESYFSRGRATGRSDMTEGDLRMGDLWMFDGFRKLANGDRRDAAELFESAQEIYASQPDSTDYFYATRLLGWLYTDLRDYPASISYLEQSLADNPNLSLAVGNGIESSAHMLENLGWNHFYAEQYDEAVGSFLQSLSLYQNEGNRYQEAAMASSLGFVLEQKGEIELAILFYKQFINIAEQLRQELQALPTGKSGLRRTVLPTDIYRKLSELLLQQDRVLEAQRVLDLLKVQELQDYLESVRGNARTVSGVEFYQPEQEILNRYSELQSSAIEISNRLAALQQKDIELGLSPEETSERNALYQLQKEIHQQFNDFLASSDIRSLIAQLNQAPGTLPISQLSGQRDKLDQLNAVLIYPLVLDDRIELIITTPNAAPLRRTVQDVRRDRLNGAILRFREALQHPGTPTDEVKASAYQLYQWLIEPLEADLADADLQTILYAPDGPLRYIPLAALYDSSDPENGKWLIERFRINNITATSLQEIATQPVREPRVLAGAFVDTSISYPADLGNRTTSFSGLPFAGIEVATLADTLTNTQTYIDGDFSLAALEPQFSNFNILHFATHAALVPKDAGKSFILFGDGSQPTIEQIATWSLEDVDLVVLSACETGLGGFDNNGEQILGLGYQFQERGARAVIASLWQVDDGGTQVLMNAFYLALRNGYSKAEALQRAQQALINDDMSFVGESRAGVLVSSAGTGEPITLQGRSDHPYYWAPFILIGNGL